MLELAWFFFLPGLGCLFCQLSIPQIPSGHWGSVAALACGSLSFQSCRAGTDLPVQRHSPQVVRFWAAAALGVKQSYWALAALSDSLEMHNSGFPFTFFYIFISVLVLYLLTGLNSIKTDTTVIETTWFFVHCLMP